MHVSGLRPGFLRAIAAAVISVGLAACFVGTARAQANIPGYPDSIFAFDPREIAMLPPYCIHTQHFRAQIPEGNNPQEIDKWTAFFGDTFQHLHHYCYGLMDSNRANLLAKERAARRFYLQNSVREFDYVLERAPKDFILLPEILTRKGENLLRDGQGLLGIEQLQRAAELKPDYWTPYAYMSDYYKDSGDLKKARELLESGLAFSPDSKGLRRRLGELDVAAEKRKSAPRSGSRQDSATR